MKCSHCLESFFEKWTDLELGGDSEGTWYLHYTTCPSCEKFIIKLSLNVVKNHAWVHHADFPVRPIGVARAPLPKEVLEKYSKTYIQASQVLPISPEASAALSRRCLQHLLREEVKVKPSDLSDEIQQVMDSGKLSSTLSDSIDAIRNIGNFAAHPIKSTNSGEVVDVEPGEAEWTLDVLEELFDHYLVKPKILQQKRDALNKKLEDAGKKPMK